MAVLLVVVVLVVVVATKPACELRHGMPTGEVGDPLTKLAQYGSPTSARDSQGTQKTPEADAGLASENHL